MLSMNYLFTVQKKRLIVGQFEASETTNSTQFIYMHKKNNKQSNVRKCLKQQYPKSQKYIACT